MSDEINSFITKKAIDELILARKEAKALEDQLLETADAQLKAAAASGSIKTPSGLNDFTEKLKQLNAALKDQEGLIAKQQGQIDKLTEKLAKNSIVLKGNIKLSDEERVSRRYARQEAEKLYKATTDLFGAYSKLSAQVAIASKTYQDILVRGRLATQTQKEFDRELAVARSEFQKLQAQVLAADKAVDKWSRTGERSIGMLRNLLGAFGISTGVQLFAQMSKEIFEQVKLLQTLDKSFELITGTAHEAAYQFIFLQDISKRYGLEINSLQDQFTKFYVAAKDKASGRQIQQIFESVAKAGASLGLSNENLERTFLALNQMYSKGTVQAEELKTQLGDALPGAIGIMQRAYQKLHPEQEVTSRFFQKLMKDGKLLSSEVLPEFARELERTYGIKNVKNIDNIVNAQNRLSNAWVNFIRQVRERSTGGLFQGILNRFGKDLDKFTEYLKTDEQKRKEYLDLVRSRARDSAGIFLERYKDAQEKEQVANDLILKLEERAQGITDKIQGLAAKNKEIRANQKFSPFGQSDKDSAAKISANNKAIQELNNQLAKTYGKIDGLRDAAKNTSDDVAENEVKNLRERTKANKDYLQSQYEIIKLQLENAIKYNTAIMNDETQSFDQRKRASIQLVADRIQLAELEYKEELRRNEFKMKDDLRVNEAERRNAISQKGATAKYIEQINNDAKEKEIGIVTDAENKKLLAHIKYADQRKTIYDDMATYLKGVEERIKDATSVNLVNAGQLGEVKALRDLMQAVNRESTEKDYKDIEDLKLQITRNTSKELLKIQIERNKQSINEFEKNAYEREQIEKRIELLRGKGALDKQEQDEVDYLQNVLDEKYKYYNLDSEAYAKLVAEKIRLTTQQSEEEAKLEERRIARIKRLQEATKQYLDQFQQGFVQNAGLGSLNKFFDKNFDELTGKYKSTFENLIEGAHSTAEQMAVAFTAFSEVAKEVVAFLDQGSQAYYDNEAIRLKNQYDLSMKYAGDSDAAKQEIEKDYAKRQVDLQRKEAKAKKENARFSTIINTAQGVVSALASTPPNVPLSILIGLIGAAQLAAIDAQQIPQYWKGGVTEKDGTVMVNDDPHGKKGANFKEVIKTPSGKLMFPQMRNQLMNLPKGSEVFPDYEAFLKSANKMLDENGIDPMPQIRTIVLKEKGGADFPLNEVLNGFKGLEEAIENQPGFIVEVNEYEIQKHLLHKAKKTKIENSRIKIESRNV